MRLFLLLLLVPSTLSFVGYTPESFPNSMEQPGLCSQDVPGFLCDPTKQLSKGNITANYERLKEKLAFLRYNTTCKCGSADVNLGQCLDSNWGFTVSVAVVDKIILNDDQHDRDSVLRAAEVFAEGLRRRFPRGHCEDDSFILLSTQNNAVWTSVGKVAQRYLTPELINKITLQAESHFKTGDYTDGLVYMISSFNKIFNGQKLDSDEVGSDWVWPIPKWLVIVLGVLIPLLLIAIVVACICCCVKKCCMKDRRGSYNTVNRL